jgi:hypothetical protein
VLSVCFLIGDVHRAVACPLRNITNSAFCARSAKCSCAFRMVFVLNRDYFLRLNLSMGPCNADTLRLLSGGVDNSKEYIS